MPNLYKTVEAFVEDSFKGGQEMRHFRRAAYWLKRLKPDADEAMLIAAISHDIERSTRVGDGQTKRLKNSGMKGKDFLKYHQDTGAKIIANFFKGSWGS